MNIGISYIGIYVPEKILTNDALSQIVDTNDEWISTRTGIKERHIAENESTIDLAVKAVHNLLEKGPINIKDVDFILCSTATHNQRFPSLAAHIHKEFGIQHAPFIDINPACSGFVYTIAMAESFIKSGLAKKVLCVCAEKMTDLINWEDRNTCVLFGDAAAAFIVEENPKTCTIVNTVIGGNGEYVDLLQATTQENGKTYIQMDGTGVFKQAVKVMDEQVRKVCALSNKTLEDIDLLVPHQANARIMFAVAERLGLPNEKAFMNVEKYGNTSSATIPLALTEAIQEGFIKQGSLVVAPALGGGFTWGATLLQF